MNNFSNQAAFNEALSTLHRYVRSMYISVEIPAIEQNALEEYFNCEDYDKSARFEKIIKAAAVEAIYNDTDIPKPFKAKVAKRASRELVETFRAAKVDYEYSAGKYGSGLTAQRKYEREKKKIRLCREVAFLDKVKKNLPRQTTKIAAKAGVNAALAAGGFTVGGPMGALIGFSVGLAMDAVWYLTPDSVKEKARQKCGEIAQKAVSIVKKISTGISETPVFKKAKNVVDTYVAPLVKPVYEKAKESFEKVTSSVSRALTKGKKWLKSLFA